MKKLPITGLAIGSVSPATLVCGDPNRATKIAQHLNNTAILSENREYRAYQGHYQDTLITVCSHGVGAPGAAIAFEELIVAGAQQIIRVGTCGGLQPHLQSGALVIATAAVQNTGYGRETVPIGYPAVADMRLTNTLQQTANSKELTNHSHPRYSGIVVTRDNFYSGVDTPQTPHYATLAAANVLAVEMECAALFIVGSLRSVQTAAILAVDGNVLQTEESIESYNPHQTIVAEAVTTEIIIALKTLSAYNTSTI